MVERDGQVITRVVKDVKGTTLLPHILANVEKSATVRSDELWAYMTPPLHGYKHGAVNHSKEEWVRDGHHTNTIEAFWSMLKRSIRARTSTCPAIISLSTSPSSSTAGICVTIPLGCFLAF